MFVNFVSKEIVIFNSGSFGHSFGGFSNRKVFLDSVTDAQKFVNNFLVGVDFIFHRFDHDGGHYFEETEMFVSNTTVVFNVEVFNERDDTSLHRSFGFQKFSSVTRFKFGFDNNFDVINKVEDGSVFSHSSFESFFFGFSLGVENIKHSFSGIKRDVFGG